MQNKPRMWIVLIFGLLSGSAFAQGPPPTESTPELVFAGTEVTVSGITPGSEVVLLTVWREVGELGGSQVTILDETLPDDDADGVVTYTAPRPVPSLSAWAVVDVESGLPAVATPGAFEPRLKGPGAARGGMTGVELDLSRAEILWVRPGLGGLRGRVGDGTGEDLDGKANGRARAAVANFIRKAGEPSFGALEPPQSFEAGDVVVGIDSGTLEVVLYEVPGQDPPTP